MKERYVKRNNYIQSDVDYFVSQGCSAELATILSCKGITEENYSQFMCGEMLFHNPFEMVNMEEAAETLSYVMESGGCVLICGDYDADGLTSSSLLSLFLTDNGVENDIIIPTREEGYGLHFNTIAEAFSKKYYDLVITVDNGISNKTEIDEVLANFDTEFIVTDHHELPVELPNCLCVNPKMGYPFPMLSGAGVAWKLVEAVAGREVAMNYVALAMIGTIADIMSLTDENRSIVLCGLNNFNHKSLQKLADESNVNGKITANDIAMKIAPKINAAGRMGDPRIALNLLLARDKCDSKLVSKLIETNEERRALCDTMVTQANKMLSFKTIYEDRMVYLYSDGWHHGLLGIVASRCKETYGVPAICMAKNDDGNYVGSARGVDGVDLFDAFNSCKDLLIKFGGHKGSCGFTVSESNLPLLQSTLSQYFNACDDDCFSNYSQYDIELTDGDIVADIYNLSEKLSPCLPQDRLICRIKGTAKFANVFGRDNNHLSITLDNGFELKGFFNYVQFLPYIHGAEIDVLCTLDFDSYAKNVYGTIVDFQLCNSLSFDELFKQNYLRNVTNNSIVNWCTLNEGVLLNNSILIVFDDYATLLEYCKKYNFDDYSLDIFLPTNTNSKRIVVSPSNNYPFEMFENVVVISNSVLKLNCGNNAIYVKSCFDNSALYSIEFDRNVCVAVYSAFRTKSKFDSVRATFDKYLSNKITYSQYILAIRVLSELGIVIIKDKYNVLLPSSEKVDLESSILFQTFANK